MKFDLERFRLPNVAPYCTVTTSGWTGSATGEVLATGDGATTTFSGTVQLPPVNPLDSFTVHYTIGGTAYSVTAQADGTISDSNVSGSVAQVGTWSLNFNTAPDAADITADYSCGIEPDNLSAPLDHSNPQPSGWGYTTKQGNFGYFNIVPPRPGFYIVKIVVEGTYPSIGKTGDTSLTTQFSYYGGAYYPSPPLYLKLEPETRIMGWISPILSPGQNASLSFYASALQTVKIRLMEVRVFRVA